MSRAIYVTPKQYKMLQFIATRRSLQVQELAELMETRQEDLMRDLAELESKGLISMTKTHVKYFVLSSIGELYRSVGFPEEFVYSTVVELGERKINEVLEEAHEKWRVPKDDLQIGLQYLIKGECVGIERDVVRIRDVEKCRNVLAESRRLKTALENLAKGLAVDQQLLSVLRRRKLVEARERAVIVVSGTNKLEELWSAGLIKERELLTVVRPEHAPYLDRYIVKGFDLSIEPPTPPLSKKHPFMQFIDELREIMVGMGFEEVKGPHVEAELWNFDALFQAQDHPAREIHDTFFVKTELRATPPIDVIERARRVHEVGWGYKWSPEKAMRLVLRSQTTAVSARALYERGCGEYRVFTIDRNFRPESLDAKHSMEFYQLDGVIVGREVNFKHLLYFFKEFAAALGIKEVWFKPGYFPFTEPSVEGYVKHPKLGWIEVFPGGMFRPEVMEILGAPGYNAAAWGIGVDRLAMVVLNIDDIRLLFTRDIETLRRTRYLGLPYFSRKTSGKDVVVSSMPK